MTARNWPAICAFTATSAASNDSSSTTRRSSKSSRAATGLPPHPN